MIKLTHYNLPQSQCLLCAKKMHADNRVVPYLVIIDFGNPEHVPAL